MRRLLNVWRNMWHRDRLERDLDDELRATVDALAAEHETRGIPPDAARRAALLEVGGIESVKQQVREARTGSTLETTLQDVRDAARLLRRNPLFTLTAVTSLAIGIGATTSIFTVANSVLLRAAPGVTDPAGSWTSSAGNGSPDSSRASTRSRTPTIATCVSA